MRLAIEAKIRLERRLRQIETEREELRKKLKEVDETIRRELAARRSD
jgi:hypothetical protein